MLRKLWKYEFKSTARSFGLTYLVLLIGGFLVGMGSRGSLEEGVGGVMYATLLMAFVLCMFAAVMITLVLNVNRFQKGVFKDEGYLLNTLPVSSWKLIAGKLLPAMVWTIATVAVMILSLFEVIILFTDFAPFEFLMELTNKVLYYIREDMGVYTLLYIVLGLLALMCIALHVYAAICLGHLFHGERTAMTIVMWLVINFLMSLTCSAKGLSFLGTATPYSRTLIDAMFYVTIKDINFIPQIVFYLIWNIILWAVCQYVLTKRLNLD